MISTEPEFALIAPKLGELDAMVIFPDVRFRADVAMIAGSLLIGAARTRYLLSLPKDEETFVGLTLENFRDLRAAVAGERVRVNQIVGVGGVSFPDGGTLSTPWGTLQGLPFVDADTRFDVHSKVETNCLLSRPRFVKVEFDRSPVPPGDVTVMDVRRDPEHVLLPLAFALATESPRHPLVPSFSWTSCLRPFSIGFGAAWYPGPPSAQPMIDASACRSRVEQWSRLIHENHCPSLDFAAQRMISACRNQRDSVLGLVDAVMVWESLFGSKTEVTFSVTASIAKLLEAEPPERQRRMKELKHIYGTRSKVVHGEGESPRRIAQDAEAAIEVAVEMLRRSYPRGRKWLSQKSTERVSGLLLGD